MQRPSCSTATGDDGSTSLYGGERISKTHPRLHAYGTVDELNACIGLVLAEQGLPEEFHTQLSEIQKMLFIMGSDLATPLNEDIEVPRIELHHIDELELWGMQQEESLPSMQKFILPTGCKAGALLHQARTVCRRAERWMVDLAKQEDINSNALVYINRLSDYLFLTARSVNKAANVSEVEWLP